MTRMHPLPTFSNDQLIANIFKREKVCGRGQLTILSNSVQAEMNG